MNKTASQFSDQFLTDERWLKAAVAGGLWAAVEIIIGSFLHNLRVPFAGSILSAFAVMLMVSFHRLWPVRGLVWRAGLVCALMKSVSPSALIFGPMIGIMSEAILIEVSLRIMGFNKAGYILGGILGVCSALVHKVVSILLLYGADIIGIYLNIYRFALKQSGMPDADPLVAVSILVGVYVAAGTAAAIIGISVPVDDPFPEQKSNSRMIRSVDSPFSTTGNHSLILLVFHLLSVPLMIFLIVRFGLVYGGLIVVIWAVLLNTRYRQVYRRFRKPVLWIQFLITILIAALFWERDCDMLICFSIQGFNAGISMTLRAIVIIMAFSAIGFELRNPLVRMFLEEKGFRNLYLAIVVAFSALPYMVAQIPDARSMIRHPARAIAGALANARVWLTEFERDREFSLKNGEIDN